VACASVARIFVTALLVAAGADAAAQRGDAVLLVANPEPRDLELDYREAVVIAGRWPDGGYIGVILNRPTRRSLASLFPEHAPSKKVAEPVYYGGPRYRDSLVALVKSDSNPGEGSVRLMDGLYFAYGAATIDHIIETAPNSARYYVGYVRWRPGELEDEIDQGDWAVLRADIGTAFKKDTEGLWEELLIRSRRLRASTRRGTTARPAG